MDNFQSFELLTDEQRKLIATAITAARAAACLRICEGLNVEAVAGTMITALTTVLEKAYTPAERPKILEMLLRETLAGWQTEAASAAGRTMPDHGSVQ